MANLLKKSKAEVAPKEAAPTVCHRSENLRRQLVEERQRLLSTLDVSRRGNWGRSGITDQIDVATEEQDAGAAFLAMASGLGSLAQVDDALCRMEEGTYGLCEECGQAIAPARLRALPFASLCRRCKEQEERDKPPGRSARPIGFRLAESDVQTYWSD